MKRMTNLDHHFYQNRYIYLFTATMLQVFLTGFFPERSSLPINAMVSSFFMLSIINFIRRNHKIIAAALLAGVLALFLVWAPEVSQIGNAVLSSQRIIVVLFICFIISRIVTQIIRSQRVDMNVIFGVITIYILFGLLAGEVNLLILYNDPAAFAGDFDISDPADLRYFGYITITTVGFGDITPISQVARASAAFFALTAQIYLAVIIAFIVGKYVSHSGSQNN